MKEITTFNLETLTAGERCLGQVRWAPTPMFQGHRPKLQQLWEVVTYKDGKPWSRDEQWRDVPPGDNEAL